MGEQKENEFVWVLKNFPSLQDEIYYSRTFSVAGYNWRLLAYPKGSDGDGYLSLYLQLVDPEFLPRGWTRQVKFTLTVVSKRRGKWNKVLGGLGCLDTMHKVLGIDKFMSLTKLHAKGGGFLVKNKLIIVAELHVLPAVVVVPEENVSITRPLSSKDENQVDDGAPEEDNDDDNDGTDEFEEASCLVLNDSATSNGTIQTVDVNGFDVFTSRVEYVKLIFERHPDIAVGFNAKNRRLRNVCMSFLLGILDTLCQSLEKLSNEDLVEADIALTYLKDTGFKVDWVEKKLDQLKDKKEKEQLGLAQLQEIEETLLKLKKSCSELQTLAEEEKADLSAIRTALYFDDLV